MNNGVTSDTSGSTSTSLLGRVRQHDADAWRRLVQIYGPLVYRWARRAGLNDSDAADIGQEVFRTVAIRIGSFQQREDGGSFHGWLSTITRNKLGNFFRHRAGREQGVSGSAALQQIDQVSYRLPDDDIDDGDEDVKSKLLQRALHLMRTEFEERTWLAFWRAAIDGHTTNVIADDLKMTPKAVRQAKYRVLRRLRDEFDQLLD